MMGLVAGGRLGDVNSVQKCSVVCVRIASLSCGQEAPVRAGNHQGYCPVVTPVSFPQTTRGDVAEAVLARDGGSSLSDVRHIILRFPAARQNLRSPPSHQACSIPTNHHPRGLLPSCSASALTRAARLSRPTGNHRMWSPEHQIQFALSKLSPRDATCIPAQSMI